MLEVDLSGIIPALKFAREELMNQSDVCVQEKQFRQATRIELEGLILLMRHRGVSL